MESFGNDDVFYHGPHGYGPLGTVMMTFLLFTPASRRWLVCGRTENPRRDGLA